MKRYTLSFFSTLILGAYAPINAYADLQAQCLAGVPHFTGKVVQGNPNQLPVYIEADKALLNHTNQATYKGNVQIRQGNRYLSAKEAEVQQLGNKENAYRNVSVSGGFDYQDNLIYLLGDKAKLNLSNRSATIENGLYQLVDRQGRGNAKEIDLEPDYRILKDSTFTTCLPSNNSWKIKATEMKQYIKKQYAEMWNARFYVGDVPVFYLPYFQFPLGDERRSGLLIPSYGTGGRDGYWVSIPVYWNIAPNMDATFTQKAMSRRGYQEIGEYRILTPLGQSTFAGEYIKHDRYPQFTDPNKSRHLFYWEHNANLASNWRLHVDYTRVSDPTYFDDFDSQYGHSTDGYATQEFQLNYDQENYNFQLSTQKFQVFSANANTPYKTLPKLDYNYYHDNIGGLVDFHLFSQAVQFKNDNRTMPKAWRFHIEPTLTLPLSNRYGGIQFETRLYATRYLQKSGDAPNAYAVKSHLNRVIPEFKVGVNTLLSKNFDNGYTQTIEPQMTYMYRPYRNQADIGAPNSYGYDSSDDYSGLDRILSANQVRSGATTRFYDENGIERFNLGAAQTYYFTDSRAQADRIKHRAKSTDWELTSNYYINPQWNLSSAYHYDAEYHHTSSASTAIQYRPTADHLIQLSYRYINQNELANYDHDIKQVGITAAWSFLDNWAVVGKNYYDIALKKPVDQFFGIQYNSCCWALSVGVNRYVETRSDQQPGEVLYNHNVGLRFEFRGFSHDYNSGVQRMLAKGKLPYISPFNL
ncbi:LPS assembly protein LptD [Actinobacillus delphinicola]|uniref:LPS-assembly protein LptD n=1 Tax=Actinobacillus delphinicola TaxID=51161 RepID=A0A448TU21_9PAST|nr:LPS assembly protein LptD [Actinobacillus delphinicola]VEJ09343.1 organic solvent tolerance protein [Actinobacillus delphinicola]